MKKTIIIAAALMFSVAAIKATTSDDRTKQLCDLAYVSVAHSDTVPSDTTKDTTKDTSSFAMLSSYQVKDTVPTDTSKKDTSSFSLAYNIVRDTVPADTTKDTSAQFMALVR